MCQISVLVPIIGLGRESATLSFKTLAHFGDSHCFPSAMSNSAVTLVGVPGVIGKEFIADPRSVIGVLTDLTRVHDI